MNEHITTRDYFAAMAMQSLLLTGVEGSDWREIVAAEAYHIADAMLLLSGPQEDVRPHERWRSLTPRKGRGHE